jgi:hypothetical protein
MHLCGRFLCPNSTTCGCGSLTLWRNSCGAASFWPKPSPVCILIHLLNPSCATHTGTSHRTRFTESLKNCLLVMSTSAVLPPTQAAHLWKLTRSRLDTFLPGLMAEVFPAAQLPRAETALDVASVPVKPLAEALRGNVAPTLKSDDVRRGFDTTWLFLWA